jgi:hypothetical protein
MSQSKMKQSLSMAREVTQSEYEFNQRWYKSLCERRLQLMKSEAFYAKQRRQIEKAIILFQVDGRWNGEYIDG